MRMHRSRGFTLIEVLVAMLIVAVGILGVAGLQVVSLQQNRNALLRDTSLQLGNDIMDRMRANSDTVYSPVTFDDTPSFATDCLAADCNQVAMRDYDLAQWKCRLNPFDADNVQYEACVALNINAASLPGGRGSITGGTVAGQNSVVTVEWTSDRDGNVSQIILRAPVTEPPVVGP